MEDINQAHIKQKNIKLDIKESKNATGRRKRSIAKVWNNKEAGTTKNEGLTLKEKLKNILYWNFII